MKEMITFASFFNFDFMRKWLFTSILTLISFVIHAQSCPDDNHPHAIDLGLPSGTKWACCNVGADAPMQYGEYFSWGETAQKEEYTFETYSFCHSDNGDWSNVSSLDWDFLGEDIGGTQYDAAYVKWGEDWRMPSLNHIKELIEYCEYEPMPADSEIKGLVFTGPNNQSIFLPAGYWVYLGKLKNVFNTRKNILLGYYWTSSQNMDYDYFYNVGYEDLAFALEFNAVPLEYYTHETIENVEVCEYRLGGMNVRPIQNVTSSINMVQKDATSSSKGIFTIQGTRVSDDAKHLSQLPNGLYIVNGRKMAIR